MKEIKDKWSIGDIGSIAIFTLIPLVACLIMCIKDGIGIADVYLANSRWNDEAFYYKMIGAVDRYGQPLGYFGYNGSTARIGHFGPWSPALFVFYILYAKLFGWSLISPIYCNIMLMVIAMGVFALLTRPNKRQICSVFFLYCSCTIITRYVFSSMSEISIYALLIIYLGIAIKMLRQEEKHNICFEIILNIITFILVLMRPYWLLLTVLPGFYWFSRSNKKLIVVFESAWSAFGLAMYFFINQYFCAAYYKSIINFEWLELIFEDISQGIYNMMHIFISSLWEILQYAGEGVINGSPVGSIYALYILVILYFIYLCRKCQGDDKTRKFCVCYFLFYLCAMLVAIIYLYDINVGSRHATGFIFLFIFIISIMVKSKKHFVLFLGFYAWLLCIRATDQYTYQIPVYTEAKEMILAKGRADLAEKGLIDINSNNPWDNTLIWLYADETTVDFTHLYAVPDGMGIELYFKDNVLKEFDMLKPKYIMTNIGEEIDLLCRYEGKEILAEYGNVHIWQLR